MIYDIIKSYQGNAIYDNNGIYTYKDLNKQIDLYDKIISGKIKDNDNVILLSDYNFYSISLLLSLSKKNINIIPLIKTTQKEFEEKVTESIPDYIIKISKNGKLIIEKLKINGVLKDKNKVTSLGSTGIILFSSGTTGKPKLMIQNLSQIIQNIQKPRRQKSLIFLLFLMFDHIGGINTLFQCLKNGAPIVIPTSRNPSSIIELIENHKVNVLPTSPTFLNMMLMDEKFNEEKLDSLKLITYGTERMPKTLLEKINKNLPKVKLLQTFGTSETGILKTKSMSSDSLFFKIIDENQQYKIIDNELYLKSNTSVGKYLNHKNSSFIKDGWFKTGDIVETNEKGYIKIIGRKNKIINVGGLKVMPNEVESIINSIDEVIDSTVYGEPNNITGNIVCAKIVTKTDNKPELKKKIKKLCISKLDKYKIPVRINFSDLEMNSRGKKLI